MTGLVIDFYNRDLNKYASLDYDYHRIHILRDYASAMVGAKDEDDEKARQEFPNLVYHHDAEGYYVGFLPDTWDKESQLWVGSVEGLYKELQRISAYMIETKYDGEAKEILREFLEAFTEIEYNPEENYRHTYIVFH
jgi:hypothetical protein